MSLAFVPHCSLSIVLFSILVSRYTLTPSNTKLTILPADAIMVSALSQRKLHPLPSGINLTERSATITGVSSGLGLEAARQLLALKMSTVILAVRNSSKAEACKSELLADPYVEKNNPKGEVKIMKVNMEDPHRVVKFADAVIVDVPVVDYLILNAGFAPFKFDTSPSGHESGMQINYLSNVLLLAALLPHLEAGAVNNGRACRISWVRSRRHESPSFASKKSIKKDESILKYMDDPKNFNFTTRYDDTKALCAMFLYQLALKLNTEKVIFNMMCPGALSTALGSDGPLPVRIYLAMVRAIKGRSVEEGAWVLLHAALVADSASHGKFLTDKYITA